MTMENYTKTASKDAKNFEINEFLFKKLQRTPWPRISVNKEISQFGKEILKITITQEYTIPLEWVDQEKVEEKRWNDGRKDYPKR